MRVAPKRHEAISLLARRLLTCPEPQVLGRREERPPRNDINVSYNFARAHGEVPEWLNGTVSKTVVGLVSTEGSNPSLSAGALSYEKYFYCKINDYD